MKVHDWLRWLVFILIALIMNFPIIATLMTAFKDPSEVMRNPSLWPETWSLANFATVFTISGNKIARP